MAHPLRLRILERVARRGMARAADIAEDLGLPANSVSYHLRTLARGGAIVEAPEAARDRRDRVWKISQRTFDSSPGNAAQDRSGPPEEYEAAASATGLASFDWMRDTWAATIGRASARPPGSEVRRLFASSLRLSPAQARELGELIGEQLQRYEALNRGPDGANRPGDPDSDGSAEDFQVLFALAQMGGASDAPDGGSAGSPSDHGPHRPDVTDAL